MLKRIRLVTQIIVLIIFIYLIIETADPLTKEHTEIFLRLSPLSNILTVIGTRHFVFEHMVPGIIVLVISLFLGRFFCGWICPLGTTI
ncbi:MAG: 4Fe-4S binding protein, partial [Candidatus Eremiobacterota bacterium]